jgi:hypothetical protein
MASEYQVDVSLQQSAASGTIGHVFEGVVHEQKAESGQWQAV